MIPTTLKTKVWLKTMNSHLAMQKTIINRRQSRTYLLWSPAC